jgi:phosphoribosylamine---glycine ligase
MRILIVGSGGREHALAWGLARGPHVEALFAAPGNAGIAEIAECRPVSVDDLDQQVALAREVAADLVVVGPEAPLVGGLADLLRSEGIAVFGPSASGARIEGSKAWAKEIMAAGGIPTARSGTFTELAPAEAFVDALGGRAVVKADGLAAGKGVTVASDRDAAVSALRDCLLGGVFGEAGRTVVVEELLDGPEVSAFMLADGTSAIPLVLAQDYKRIGEGDTGPNTGGMGAYSPLRWVDAATEDEIWAICRRSVAAMARAGVEYRGLLYTGLMLTAEGPKVLEYNCRFGDPETEVLVPRLASDLAELLMACAVGRLADVEVAWHEDAAVTVILASGGYPGSYATGVAIDGLGDAGEALVFHAGTARSGDRVVTAGGRVLAVSALGATVADARATAYRRVGTISFPEMTWRGDIAAGR